ncbi:MAG: PH domain-containing protein [Candidatus Dormibacteria bacterium]
MPADLMPGEQSLLLVRQHWSVIVGPVAGGVLVLLAGIAALVLAPENVGGVHLGAVRAVIGIALLVAALAWTLIHYLRWRSLTYLLTDRRIIVAGGVLSRFSESIALDRIQNTVLRRSLADRMLGAGEIELESAGRDGVEAMRRIPHPAQFYNLLEQAMHDRRSGPADAGRDPYRRGGGPGL